jgi:cytochrome P450 family 3 subfamily A
MLIYCLIVALNDKEILGQALIFLIAGYETTSVLLSFFFYVMATEPVIQEKVYEEIRQELGDVSEIDIRE